MALTNLQLVKLGSFLGLGWGLIAWGMKLNFPYDSGTTLACYAFAFEMFVVGGGIVLMQWLWNRGEKDVLEE